MKHLYITSFFLLFIMFAGDSRSGDLWEAIRKGDMPGVEALMSQDPGLADSKAAFWATPLHAAVACGNVVMTKFFIESGVAAEARDPRGWTPLHLASERGDTETIKILLEAGASLDGRTIDGRTAYNLAIEGEKGEAAALLLENGASDSPPEFPEMENEYFGQSSAGGKAIPFALPMLASRHDHYIRSITFSPGGKEAYWPVIDLMDSYNRWIVGSRIENGRWVRPAIAPFSKKGYDDDVPCISPDGRKLLFISRRPLKEGDGAGKENIWAMSRTGDSWSEPAALPGSINSSFTLHQQLSLDKENSLYFAGEGSGGYGSLDIYFSRFKGGEYQQPINLGPMINSPEGDYAPCISPDGSCLIFTRNLEEGWTLMVSFRGREGAWTPPSDIRESLEGFEKVNLGGSYITPDVRHLIFFPESDNEITPYWIDMLFIEDLRAKTPGI